MWHCNVSQDHGASFQITPGTLPVKGKMLLTGNPQFTLCVCLWKRVITCAPHSTGPSVEPQATQVPGQRCARRCVCFKSAHYSISHRRKRPKRVSCDVRGWIDRKYRQYVPLNLQPSISSRKRKFGVIRADSS